MTGIQTVPANMPVNPGTVLTVTCEKGYNIGGSEITCNTFLYEDFSYSKKPECIDVATFGKS